MTQFDETMAFAFPVYADGRLHPAGSALVPVEDQGFQLGLAVFETFLVEGGHAFFFEQHLARLEAGVASLEFAFDGAALLRPAMAMLMAGIAELPAAPERYALRVTLSAGVPGGAPRLTLSARELSALPADGVELWRSPLRVIGDGLAGIKATSRLRYVLARRQALAQDCYDALLFNTAGGLAEGTISNVFLYAGGVLLTPALDEGCLGGIMRQLLLADLDQNPLEWPLGEALRMITGPLDEAQLQAAEEVFLSNSTGRLIPVTRVRGAGQSPLELPGARGPLWASLAQRIGALEERNRHGAKDGYTV